MHLAAENGHASIIELLADKFRASIFERTKDGSTLMHIASLNGHADCAQMLFKKGVFLHMPNKGGARSIHTAARKGHVGIINTLLQKGEHVDVTTNVRILLILNGDNRLTTSITEQLHSIAHSCRVSKTSCGRNSPRFRS